MKIKIIKNTILLDKDDRIIEHSSENNIKQKKLLLLRGGNAAIIKPPTRAPNPSNEVKIPVSKFEVLNLSIKRTPIRDKKGSANILNIGVNSKTINNGYFFEVSFTTSEKSSKVDLVWLFFSIVSLWGINNKADKKYKKERKISEYSEIKVARNIPPKKGPSNLVACVERTSIDTPVKIKFLGRLSASILLRKEKSTLQRMPLADETIPRQIKSIFRLK